jgi:hypothetical protein
MEALSMPIPGSIAANRDIRAIVTTQVPAAVRRQGKTTKNVGKNREDQERGDMDGLSLNDAELSCEEFSARPRQDLQDFLRTRHALGIAQRFRCRYRIELIVLPYELTSRGCC